MAVLSTPSRTFPFQDLPPEIRTQIYALHALHLSATSLRPLPCPKFRQDGTAISYWEQCSTWQLQWLHSCARHPPRIPLRTLCLPSLIGTSKDICREFLPEFFAHGRFMVTSGPWSSVSRYEYSSVFNANLGMELWVAQHAAADFEDPIFLASRVETLLDKYQEEAVFRDVQFCLQGKYQSWRGVSRESWQVVALTLVWQNSRLRVETSYRGMDEEVKGRELLAVEPAVECAREMLRREGFKGFTVLDLRHIAMCLV